MGGLAKVRPTFRALGEAIVPEAASLDEAGWGEVERIVEEALDKRPAGIRRQLLAFIRLLNVLPLLRHGRTLRGLDPEGRRRFLGGIQDSRLLLLRRGFWGVRTLVFMGYYARPQAYAQVGYRAKLRGWLEHPESTPAARAAAAADADRGAGRAASGDAEPGGAGLAGHAPPPVE